MNWSLPMAKPIEQSAAPEHHPLYRMLPSVNHLLLCSKFEEMMRTRSRASIVQATRIVLSTLKTEIEAGQHTSSSLSLRLERMGDLVQEEAEKHACYSLR